MAVKAYNIPNGPKNLESVFPLLNFDDIERYYLEVKDSTNSIVATTTITEIHGCPEDVIRIHFLNAAGHIDAINFKTDTNIHESKSDGWVNPSTYPLDKTVHGINRSGVRSNDTITALNNEYGEDQKEWLDELFDSPIAWIEWNGIQGQADTFIPIVISDIKREKVKAEDRFLYEIKIEFKMSHEKFSIRN